MPTVSNMILPVPKSWDEFEEICLDAFRIKWDNPNLQRHGRQGQPQNGVDIYGDNYLSQSAGIQCKNYDNALTLKMIKSEIENAESFEPSLDVFYIATSLPTDAALQKQIRILSKERINTDKFPVGIFFWNDIVQEINTNEKIFKKHFPQLNLRTISKDKHKRLFSLLELSFYGLNLKYYSHVIHGHFGLITNEDQCNTEIICSIIECACMVTCSDDEQKKIKFELENFLKYLKPYIEGKENDFQWKVSDNYANRVKYAIKNLEHSLYDNSLLVFKIGELLARWNEYEFSKSNEEPISEEFLNKLSDYISKLNSQILPITIEKIITSYKNDPKSMEHAFVADNIFFKIKQTLLEEEFTKISSAKL